MDLKQRLLWWLGWRPRAALALGLVAGIPFSIWMSSAWGMLVVVAFLAVWVRGTRLINAAWPERLAEAQHAAMEAGARKLGIDLNDDCCFPLVYEAGGGLLINAPSDFGMSFLYVSDAFVAVFPGTTFNLVNLQTELGTTTREIYFRHVVSVEYKPPQFMIRTTSGEPLRYESSAESGEAAVNAVRRRLREGKSAELPNVHVTINQPRLA